MTDNELELERLAKAATPGPWIAARGAGWYVHRPDAEKRRESSIAFGMTPACSLVADPTAQWWEEGEAEANANLIAAANPQAILALLARVRELEQDNASLFLTVHEWLAAALKEAKGDE